jgi:hypothetical protein
VTILDAGLRNADDPEAYASTVSASRRGCTTLSQMPASTANFAISAGVALRSLSASFMLALVRSERPAPLNMQAYMIEIILIF